MNSTRSTLIGLALSAALALPLAPAAMAQYAFNNFDGPASPGATVVSTTINGLSNSGQVVGITTDSAGNTTNFRGTPASFTTLNVPTGGIANGLNTSQQVVGMAGTQAFTLNSISPANIPQTLPLVNTTTVSEAAFGINDSGAIVGQYTDSATGTTPGFVDAGGVFTTLNPAAPVNGVLAVNAQAINNNGLVAGFYATDNAANQHGFLYDTGTNAYTFLPDPSTVETANGNLALTQFLGLNDMGEAVGYYQTKDTGSQFGFLFNTNTDAYTFLDDPLAAPVNGTQVTQITGINDGEEIAGFYIDAGGVQHGFLANPVPEPSTASSLGLLLALSAGTVFVRRKRAQRA